MTLKPLVKLAELNFTNRIINYSTTLFTKVQSTPLTNPVCLHVNCDLLNFLGIESSEKNKPSFTRFINGDLDFEGPTFVSSSYSGHQFGHYVPRLGDGRAIMLGEIQNQNGDFFELQLKGAGLTPFSRSGDGRAVVRSSVREYLASAHLKALGIPTTEALSLLYGSDDVYREEIEKAAIVLRVSESFLRFGHYQYLAHTDQLLELKALVDFTIDHYFAEFKDHPNRYILFFQSVVKNTAKLFAKWQAVGFCHGVLNTDNMSILGLTIDYGPFGFLDSLDQDHICNHSDHEGRYSFGNQPAIGLWNLEQLGEALKSLITDADLKRTLETYSTIFKVEYKRLLKNKLGFNKSVDSDDEFLQMTLNMLAMTQIDYTQFFRELSHYQINKKYSFASTPEVVNFFTQYEARLALEDSTSIERLTQMLCVNPKFILRNYIAQIAIENYEKSPEILDQIFKVLVSPYEEWPELNHWSFPAPDQYKFMTVSCSS